MKNNNKIEISEYTVTLVGKHTFYRFFCPICKDFALYPKKDLSCTCGSVFKVIDVAKKINVVCVSERKQIMKSSLKKRLYEKYNGHCVYCKNSLDEWVQYGNKVKKLKPEYDHFIPLAHCKSHSEDNYVLSCNICNSFKSDLIFDNIESAGYYIRKVWELRNVKVIKSSGAGNGK